MMPEPRKVTVLVPTVDAAKYPVTRLTIEYPGGETQHMECVSNSCVKYTFTLPHYIRPRQCAFYAEMCSSGQTLDPAAARIVIQEMPK